MSQSKHEFWSELLSTYENSGQKVSAFCEEYGIAVWKFYYWKKRLNTAPASFEEVAITADVPSSGIHLSLGSLNIHVQNDFNESTLRRVLSTLSC